MSTDTGLEKGPGSYSLVPSVFRDKSGAPLFKLALPHGFEKDPGGRFLAQHELTKGGYEIALRRIVLSALSQGDAFIDIGAHWGIISLTAAALAPSDVQILAIEPHPANLTVLTTALKINRVGSRVIPIAAAAATGIGLAPLMGGMGTMGHSVMGRNSPDQAKSRPELFVPTVSLDLLPRLRPKIQGRPLVVKIDVEGLEPEVVSGGKTLIEAGLVKLLIAEKGYAANDPKGKDRYASMMTYLEGNGFKLYRLSSRAADATLEPCVMTDDTFDIVAIHPDHLPLPS